jgi:hypothetical protein
MKGFSAPIGDDVARRNHHPVVRRLEAVVSTRQTWKTFLVTGCEADAPAASSASAVTGSDSAAFGRIVVHTIGVMVVEQHVAPLGG